MKSPFGAAVYVSYAWGDKNSADAVEELRARFADTFITFRPDKYTLHAGDSFSEFINEIGKANCIIVLYSQAYFRSFYCMLELAKIIQHSKQNSSENTLEDHLLSRVIGLQVSDVNIGSINREDLTISLSEAGEDSEFVRIVEDEAINVADDSQIRVTSIPYNSGPEQDIIIRNFDSFNQVFSKKLNHLSVTDDCFNDVIRKSRRNYIRQLQANKLFNDACNELCPTTTTALDVGLESKGGLSNAETRDLGTPEQKIACLLTLPKRILLSVLNAAKNSNPANADLLRNKVSGLLMRLLPLYCQPEYATEIKQGLLARAENEVRKSIQIRYALPMSVENMMASIDEREAGYISVPISGRTNDRELVLDNAHCLYQAPEGGDDTRSTYASDTQNELMNRMGLSSHNFLNLDKKTPEAWNLATRSLLWEDFVANSGDYNNLDDQAKNEIIHDALTEDEFDEHKKPHLYFIVPGDEAGEDVWDQYAEDLHKISPKLVVLRLNSGSNSTSSKAEEREFFKHIPKLLTNKGGQ